MIKYIANSLTRNFIENNILNEENKDVCVYGLEIGISTLTSIFCVLLVSFFRNELLGGLIYLLFYCSLRTFAGGYHAKTHRSCILTFLFLYIGVMLFSRWSIFSHTGGVSVMLFTHIAVVFLLKTVDAINNPFSKGGRKKLHRISCFIIVIHSILIVSMLRWENFLHIGIYALLGDFVCCVLVVVGFIEKKIIQRRQIDESKISQ